MPMNVTGAKASLGATFTAHAATEADAIIAWGNALDALLTGMTPMNTGRAAAVAVFRAGLAGFNAANATVPKLQAAMTAAAASLATTFVAFQVAAAVPPPGPMALSLPNEPDAQAAADRVIDAMHVWLITGTATAYPSGTVVPWA